MSEHVKICWVDGAITLEPNFPTSLLAQLSFWQRLQVKQGWKRQFVNQHVDLFSSATYEVADPTVPDGKRICRKLVTLDGFLHRVKKHLTENNWTFTVEDHRTVRPTPDIPVALSKLWDKQKPAVYSALMSGGGVLACPTGFGKTHLAAALIRAYSKEALQLRGTPLVVFAAPERDINAKNYDELKTILPDRDIGIMQSGRKTVITDDVMLVTLDSLQNIDPTQVGLFICDEVHTGVSDSRSQCIQAMKSAIKFGVSATPSGRYDGKDIVIEALFGPVVYRKTYQEAVSDGILVPIEVLWLPGAHPKFGLRHYNSLMSREGKYRCGVTANAPQNKFIGDILSAIPDSMQTVAIMPTIAQISDILPFCPANTAVAHAETQATSLASRGLNNVQAISTAERKRIYQRMVDGDISKILATHVYKQGVNFPGLEVIINAGGGSSEIASKQIPGRVSRTASGKEKAYLIDFWHEWDWTTDKNGKKARGPILSDDKRRAKFYTELGFQQTHIASVDELKLKLQPPAEPSAATDEETDPVLSTGSV